MFYFGVFFYYLLSTILLYASALVGCAVAFLNRPMEGHLFDPGFLLAITLLLLSVFAFVLLLRDVLAPKTQEVVGRDILYGMCAQGFAYLYGYTYVHTGEFDPRLWDNPWVFLGVFVVFSTLLIVWFTNGHGTTTDPAD